MCSGIALYRNCEEKRSSDGKTPMGEPRTDLDGFSCLEGILEDSMIFSFGMREVCKYIYVRTYIYTLCIVEMRVVQKEPEMDHI